MAAFSEVETRRSPIGVIFKDFEIERKIYENGILWFMNNTIKLFFPTTIFKLVLIHFKLENKKK